MKIYEGWPPDATENDKKKSNVITNYQGDIYLCDSKNVREDLIEHEKEHIQQQLGNYDMWIKRYQTDIDFRLSQEVEAYKAQIKFIENTRSKADAMTATLSFAKFLSSDIYENMITTDEAIKRLTQ